MLLLNEPASATEAGGWPCAISMSPSPDSIPAPAPHQLCPARAGLCRPRSAVTVCFCLLLAGLRRAYGQDAADMGPPARPLMGVFCLLSLVVLCLYAGRGSQTLTQWWPPPQGPLPALRLFAPRRRMCAVLSNDFAVGTWQQSNHFTVGTWQPSRSRAPIYTEGCITNAEWDCARDPAFANASRWQWRPDWCRLWAPTREDARLCARQQRVLLSGDILSDQLRDALQCGFGITHPVLFDPGRCIWLHFCAAGCPRSRARFGAWGKHSTTGIHHNKAARKLLCGGGMAWAPGEGGGGFQKWASVPGPLFYVRTVVATKGAGTQILARKNFFHSKIFPTHV